VYNTAIGFSAMNVNTTGSSNIAIGGDAGTVLTTGSYNIDIGNIGVAGEGNTIRIGDINQTKTFIAGIRGRTTGQNNAVAVLIDSNGQLGTISSSLRFKQDVAAMGDTSSRLMELRPVTFHYKTQPDGPLQYGLIAEEVEQVMPELVVRDAAGQIESVAYHELPAMLLNELQKQQAQIEAKDARIVALENQQTAQQSQIERERSRNDALEARLAALEARLAGR
jgi:polyhydroxyalkanoate synthesis regulator phasin